MNAVARELARSRWPDKEQVADEQRPYNILVIAPRDNRCRAGFFHIRAELGKNFVVADADTCSHTEFGFDTLTDFCGDFFTAAEQVGTAGHIKPALVEAEALNPVGVVSVDFAGKAGEV